MAKGRRATSTLFLIMAASRVVLGFAAPRSSSLFRRSSGWVSNHCSRLQRQRDLQIPSSLLLFRGGSSSVPDDDVYGKGMDQNAMMESDMLIAVDHNDKLIEGRSADDSVSKKKAHQFSNDQPRGILHRAFSFFIFDSQNRMLLTKRASSKITFPGVWTNTCCSHPLRNMIPNEVDDPSVEGVYPSFPGIKHAAIRKCFHELGITAEYIPHENIQFITRFHYWAADTMTYGTDASCPWGEHEVDYILFLKVKDGEEIPIVPDPEEVEEYKFVTAEELKAMMEDPELTWSPWFRGIVERGFWEWWKDLDGALEGKYTNTDVVFFDPPPQHFAEYNQDPTHNREETGIFQPTSTSTL